MRSHASSDVPANRPSGVPTPGGFLHLHAYVIFQTDKSVCELIISYFKEHFKGFYYTLCKCRNVPHYATICHIIARLKRKLTGRERNKMSKRGRRRISGA